MRPRSTQLVVAALFVVLTVACSGTTVVERGERAESSGVADTADSDSASADTSQSSASDDDDSEPVDVPDLAGYGLGGPEQLASLTDDCEDGSDQACDILFQISDGDSVEESIASSCAGRGDANTRFCTEGVLPDGDDLFFDLKSPALDDISNACEEGDMTACDFLYFRSPVGSRFEELGNTCGGRTAVALPDCRTFFEE